MGAVQLPARLPATHAAPRLSQDGVTTLWAAAANGKLDVVQFLVASRADVNQANNVGRGVLSVATVW